MEIIYLKKENIGSLSNRNVYIYGAGDYGHTIEKIFLANNLKVKKFIVDDQYENKVRGKKNIELFSRFKQECNQTDVVINGISSVEHFRKMMREQVLQNIYIYFDPMEFYKCDDEYFAKYETELKSAENMYCDEYSKSVMKAFLSAKRTGNANSDIELACDEPDYFNSLTKGKFNGAYVDCGAYEGGSICQYMNFINGFKENLSEIFAFEPDKVNYALLKCKFKDEANIHCINKGVWNKRESLYFASEGNEKSKILDSGAEGDTIIEVIDIDSVIETVKVGFIKMDVEGSELRALQGARKIIKRDHPVLAISAYHKPEDLFALPQYIHTFDNEEVEYDLYLRHHGICASELILYAIPRQKL